MSEPVSTSAALASAGTAFVAGVVYIGLEPSAVIWAFVGAFGGMYLGLAKMPPNPLQKSSSRIARWLGLFVALFVMVLIGAELGAFTASFMGDTKIARNGWSLIWGASGVAGLSHAIESFIKRIEVNSATGSTSSTSQGDNK